MGSFAIGHVVLLPFPFSDLSASKLRPALVLARAGKGDWVLCQITSNAYADTHAVMLTEADFLVGGLQRVSYARPSKLFTANESLFQRRSGCLTKLRHEQVVDAIVALLRLDIASHELWGSA
jgi:mRNA interferase MazF